MSDTPLFADQPVAVDALQARRVDALARYRAAGLPGPAIEAWKYTSLDRLKQLGLAPSSTAPTVRALPATIAAVDSYRAVFVGGRFAPALSTVDGLPEGVTVESLATLIARDPKAAETALGAESEAPLAALNTAFAVDGLVLRLARGAVLDKPLHLISVGADGLAFHPRHHLSLAPDAIATVVESHVGAGAYFANTVADVVVGTGATLRHAVLQDQAEAAVHVAAVRLDLAAHATYEGFSLQVGARLARHELAAHVAGDGAECRVTGLALAAGDRHIDNTTFIDHAGPGGRSRQLFKTVLDDASRGVFQGRVLVRPHAQKTDAHQLSRALLLSRKAEMDGKPELEIYADDVRCSHGATIGSLDQEPMFYLMSRGIDRATAYRMLVEAFAVEALDEIAAAPVREAFGTRVAAWLAGRGGVS
jgi:Fe-S cluster assembly protein SufD